MSPQWQRVNELGPGSHFGEMALLGKGVRTATVSALEPGRVLMLKQEDFMKLVRKDSTLGVKLLWALGQELSTRLEAAQRA